MKKKEKRVFCFVFLPFFIWKNLLELMIRTSQQGAQLDKWHIWTVRRKVTKFLWLASWTPPLITDTFLSVCNIDFHWVILTVRRRIEDNVTKDNIHIAVIVFFTFFENFDVVWYVSSFKWNQVSYQNKAQKVSNTLHHYIQTSTPRCTEYTGASIIWSMFQ